MQKENKMGVMPVAKLLYSMAVPMMISMIVQALYNIVDSIFVARISENALASVSLAFPLQNMLIAFGVGTAVGMNALLSRSLGARQQDKVDQAANTGIFLYLCTSVVFAFVGIFLVRPFFMAQTDVQEIVDYGVAYSGICMTFAVGSFAQFCTERLLQSTGRTAYSMLIQLIGTVINLILDPILIFGLFGMPRLEVAGAAIATVTGQILSALVGVYLNLKKNPEIHIRAKLIRWNAGIAKAIYRVGVPSIVMTSAGALMNFGLNQILITFSTTATAVLGAYFKLQSFIFMPIFGLNNAMVPIVAYNFGAAYENRVKKTIAIAISTAVGVMGVGTLLIEAIPETLLSLFHASDYMMTIGVPALRIIGMHFMLAGFCIIGSSVCQAIGNPLHSLTASICRQLLILLPVAWLLSRTGNLTLVWFAFPIAEACSVVLISLFLARTMKKAKSVMREKNQLQG